MANRRPNAIRFETAKIAAVQKMIPNGSEYSSNQPNRISQSFRRSASISANRSAPRKPDAISLRRTTPEKVSGPALGNRPSLARSRPKIKTCEIPGVPEDNGDEGLLTYPG